MPEKVTSGIDVKRRLKAIIPEASLIQLPGCDQKAEFTEFSKIILRIIMQIIKVPC